MKRLAATQLLGVCVLITLVLRPGGMAGDPGIGWHLAAGERMLSNHELLRADPFLYPPAAEPWINTQWLSDIVFAAVHRLGGWPALEIMTIAIGWCICFFLLPRALGKAGVPEPVRAVSVLAALLLFSVQWFLRPVIFSFLLFALLYTLLDSSRSEADRGAKRFDWLIPPLFILWTNLHPAFVIGLLLLAIRAFSDLISNRKAAPKSALLLALSACATLINPYGLALQRQMIGLGASRYFQNLNSEWLSADFSQALFLPQLIFAPLVVVGLLLYGKKFPLFESLSAVAFLALSLVGARYIPFFAFPASILLARAAMFAAGENLIVRFHRRYTPAVERLYSGIALAVLILAVFFSGRMPGRPAGDASIVAATKIDVPALVAGCRAHGAQRIFASPDLGGALAYYGDGRAQPFIDDRNELGGIARYEKYFEIALAKAGWQESLKEIGAECVLTDEGPLRTVLSRAPGWDEIGSAGSIKEFVKKAESAPDS